MTDGLFSEVALNDPGNRAGFRLRRLEVLNWGTFDGRVWTLRINGDNALLTGDIGSGKSTIVDAITTLLLPAHRVSYNKAAGAEVRERNLRSYVLGHHKSESNEASGTSRPVGLRSGSTFSVLLGVFGNDGYEQEVTLAQVFWLRDGQSGQPDRFHVVADRELSITNDFADFGPDISVLKRRLRRNSVRVHDQFKDYGRDFRRQLGIESEQAMELFHQTVSMKAVGNLNDFVRQHMLEPFDAAEWTDRLVTHFDDLTRSHEAVVTARAQIAELAPLLADSDEHDALEAQISDLRRLRDALPFYVATRVSGLQQTIVTDVDTQVAELRGRSVAVAARKKELASEARRLDIERAGHGGNRLAEIDRELVTVEGQRDTRQDAARRYDDRLSTSGLRPVETAEQFIARQAEIGAALTATAADQADNQNRTSDLAVQRSRVDTESTDLREELASLQNRRSNIPRLSLQVRDNLCAALGIAVTEVPFAGELITVRDDALEWEGAAERVLHGFGVSLLIPDAHYAAVSEWINASHLNTRIVYYRILAGGRPRPRPALDAGVTPLYSMLAIKSDSPFHGWLDEELAKRADHACVDTMTEFRRARDAVTRQGLIKRDKRHEKDDRAAISDRRNYVLGWDNQQKIDALLDQMSRVQAALTRIRDQQDTVTRERQAIEDRRTDLGLLNERRDFTEIDWRSAVRRIEHLGSERRQLQKASAELSRLTADLERVQAQIDDSTTEEKALDTGIGKLQQAHETALAGLAEAAAVLAQPESADAAACFGQLDIEVGRRDTTTVRACELLQTDLTATLTKRSEVRSGQRTTVATRIVGRMQQFRQHHPLQAAEVDASVAAAGEYRELHRRLAHDDLPRFESDFKRFLNQNTIRDIAMFSSTLTKQLDQIRERITTINDSLHDIDYNPGRFIRLVGSPTPNTEIREFRTELRACTDDTLVGDDSEQYSEQKFVQVKKIIERFRGREGFTDADRQWTRRVTDVRHWLVFSASERWRESDAEHENYTDSGGKSGGQKEKLAYTILAASLAYQFKLEWGATRSRTFRFAVIDEAFGRGSENSTRFALDLFQRLGLQLLIVTPLQKIHVIEPYVAAVGFVDNLHGDNSRLQNLTVEEYRALQVAHAVRGAVRVNTGTDG
ncbi:MAG: ATP-binding protein [Nakamurella sp.]